MSETKPHRLLPAKTTMLAQNTGVATISASNSVPSAGMPRTRPRSNSRRRKCGIMAQTPQIDRLPDGDRREAVASNPWRDHNAGMPLEGTYASSAATDLAQGLPECMHKHRPRSLDPFLPCGVCAIIRESAGYPKAGRQRIEQQAALEDGKQRRVHFGLGFPLLALISTQTAGSFT